MRDTKHRFIIIIIIIIRWIVFSETAGYTHMDEDVEAVQCYCNRN